MARSFPAGMMIWMLLLGGMVSSAAAQSILDDLYGQGVHAYFEGDYDQAQLWLSQAIDQHTEDPRVYYFRGLTRLQMGDDQAAQQDFARGAQIEATGTAQFYPIAESLARVQGAPRMEIEASRKAARVAARQQVKARQKARYEAAVAAEARVLRGAAQQAASTLPEPELQAEGELPFPQYGVDLQANTDFSVLGSNGLENLAKLPARPEAEVTQVADPSDPFAATNKPDDETATDSPAAPENPAGGVRVERVFGGLLRALGGQLPDPSTAAAALPVPGLPGQPADDGFDLEQPETEVGDDPFGTDN